MDRKTSSRKKKLERRQRRARKKGYRGSESRRQVRRDSWIEKLFSSDPQLRIEGITKAENRIQQCAREIEDLVDGFDPLGVIANSSVRHFLIDPETYKESTHNGDSFVVELLTLLLLRHPYKDGRRPLWECNFDKVDELAKEIKLLTIFSKDAKRGPVQNSSEEKLAFRSLQFRASSTDISIRAPGYDHHLTEDLLGIFQPMKDELEQLLGFSIDDVIQID